MIFTADLTDAQIDEIAAQSFYPRQMRETLTAQRDAARDEEAHKARVAAERLEMEQSDAGKADRPQTQRLTLSVGAGMLVGKTTLLLFLIDALADAGILTYEDTRKFTDNPMRFIQLGRIVDDQSVETIALDLDLGGVMEAVLTRAMGGA